MPVQSHASEPLLRHRSSAAECTLNIFDGPQKTASLKTCGGSIVADTKKTFTELLKDAPLAAQEDTVTLVGALARSRQSGKFVLHMGPAHSVTLDVDAVKDHQVLDGGVGQLLVRVDIDRAKAPDSVAQLPAQAAAAPFALATPHHAALAGAAVNPGLGLAYTRQWIDALTADVTDMLRVDPVR